MSKLSLPKMYDIGLVQSTKAYQELTKFFDYVNDLASQTIKALSNGIGIKDNLDAQLITQDLKHNTPLTVKVNKRPIAILVAQQTPTTPHITSLVWQLDEKNLPVITIKLDDTTYTQALTVNLIVLFS